MTKDSLLKRKADLEQGVAQVNDQLKQLEKKIQELVVTRNATIGAIEDCNYWIEKDNEKNKPKEKKNGESKK